VLQDGSKSLWVWTPMGEPLRVGDRADATGFPDVHSSFLALNDGEIQDNHIFAPVAPQPSTWHQLAQWNGESGIPDGHQNDLVSIEGQVAAAVREASQDEFVIASDGKLVTAIYKHPLTSGSLPPIRQIPLGAKVRVAGICMALQADPINPNEVEVPFNILLRSFDDITVIAKPSLLNIRNLIIVLSVMLSMIVAVGAWGWTMKKKVLRQTYTLDTRARFEQRRSRILEEINGAEPLFKVIQQVAEAISFKLDGAPCWCEMNDGSRLGDIPPKTHDLRIVRKEISAHASPPLGTLFAGFDPLIQSSNDEEEALAEGARLAALAVETRRLYTDLRRRSEFDLLTDAHNRFSLDKHLDARIAEAKRMGAIFGLVYIDLDKFKQINDLYGHHIGDLYLQEASLRMKRQLRSQDMLARLGGDEFAALVPEVRSRAGVEEIALRMERCFDDPFLLEGFVIHGSASVGYAVYPEDGDTDDSLLNAADAAMYAAKHAKMKLELHPANSRTSDTLL
jgi:diguanylate cyclase (GGDEF)-like protein